MLHNVATLYERKQLLSKVILVDNRKALFDKHYSWRMDYTEVCKYVMESNSVIEILQDGQEGISLRVFESLFFEKKLVTNNRHIVDYDFMILEMYLYWVLMMRLVSKSLFFHLI